MYNTIVMAPKRPSTSESGSSASKKARKSITLEEKLDVLDRIDKGQKTSLIVAALKLSESTIRTIRGNASKIWASAKSGAPVRGCKSSYSRPAEMERMEKMLATWIDNQNKNLVPISYKLIQAKAKSIYENLEKENKKAFSASSGWFSKFKRRFGFHNIKMVGDGKEYPEILKQIIEDYSPKQVFFNIDETGLHWKKLPNRTYISKEVACLSDVWKKLCPQFVNELKGFDVDETPLANANMKTLSHARQVGFEELEEKDISEHLQSHKEELSNEDSLEIERERVQMKEEAEAGPSHRRTLTATNLSECMNMVRQAMKILQENDPNVERSDTAIRGVMSNLACYEIILKQQKKKQQIITTFFKQSTPTAIAEAETDPDDSVKVEM